MLITVCVSIEHIDEYFVPVFSLENIHYEVSLLACLPLKMMKIINFRPTIPNILKTHQPSLYRKIGFS